MRSDEIRRTNDQIVGSQLDKTKQAKSQDSGSKGLFEKARQYLGPASAALILGGVAFRGFVGIVGAEGSTPEAHSTALTQRDSGSDKAIGLPPAFPTDQRAGFIGKSPTSRMFLLRGQNGFLPTRVQRHSNCGLICMTIWLKPQEKRGKHPRNRFKERLRKYMKGRIHLDRQSQTSINRESFSLGMRRKSLLCER